jgi:hypothetical protein
VKDFYQPCPPVEAIPSIPTSSSRRKWLMPLLVGEAEDGHLCEIIRTWV